MKFQRLDKVKYLDEIVYIHHFSEEGLTPTAWLYGVPDNKKRSVLVHEPVGLNSIVRLARCTDFLKWTIGNVGIDNLGYEDKQELLSVCIKNCIDVSDADIACYYKSLWFILDNQLKSVQTIAEANEQKIWKMYDDLLEYICEHEK